MTTHDVAIVEVELVTALVQVELTRAVVVKHVRVHGDKVGFDRVEVLVT